MKGEVPVNKTVRTLARTNEASGEVVKSNVFSFTVAE
jgi:hypothetical protein